MTESTTDNEFDKALGITPVAKEDKPAAAPKATRTKKAVPKSIELTEEEKRELEEEAAAEVAEEERLKARDSYKQQQKLKARKKVLFQHGKDEQGNDTEVVLINLASHAPFIRLDNNVYYHGRAYRVNKAKAASLKDIMYQTWRHSSEISGENMNQFYGKQQLHATISPTQPTAA